LAFPSGFYNHKEKQTKETQKMAIGKSTIKKDLKAKYGYTNNAEIVKISNSVYDIFKAKLRADIGGAYGAAFETAEARGIISIQESSQEPIANPGTLEQLADCNLTPDQRTFVPRPNNGEKAMNSYRKESDAILFIN